MKIAIKHETFNSIENFNELIAKNLFSGYGHL
jgi:hypothetical protein